MIFYQLKKGKNESIFSLLDRLYYVKHEMQPDEYKSQELENFIHKFDAIGL